ncbi:acetate--CoA ligase family protein [Marinobacter oulmenensis]|uniref:Acyl-CoA synthetase (NDP forming) n=1 Tax=Marinobacter oulmenensis TaxID=643747 RepID=A0A840U7H3_9GAMM|nr:acetate--CoA ligase family protein [Marinobacter oulmenensis]MBB5321694.1 acyl-CoA synthetase (NDP forming) [Marinobacter oulmenensis]
MSNVTTGPALAKALLNPDSVVLVGISNNLEKTAARPLQFLRRAGFKGRIYNVNPTRKEVQNEKAYPSLSDLPEIPDHAFILTNTEHAIEAVEECGVLGIPVATVLAGGFSESGPAGQEREIRLKAVARRGGVRLLGPSSIGLVNVHNNLTLTANAAFGEPGLPPGGIFCASHSGSLIGALTSRGRTRNIGFHSLVSVGGESDLSIGEICESTLDNPDITGYLLFLETSRNADKLRHFALAAARRGKPVVAYRLGRSQIAAELAVSHTGALAGEDSVTDALLRDCGIARVDTFEGLLESLPLLARTPFRHAGSRAPRVGVVTTTGGGAAMAVDQLGIRGIDVIPPSDTTREKLREAGIDSGTGRILDLTLAGTRYEVMKPALDILCQAPEFDLVLATVGSSARNHPHLAVKPVSDSIDQPTPLACFIVPEAPEALNLLSEAGVPNFRTPETCGDVIAAALNRRAPNPDLGDTVPAMPESSRPIDEAAAYQLFAGIGLPHADFVVLDVDAPIPALPFDYPVAVKLLNENITHKTDVGGVMLSVRNDGELKEAISNIRYNVEKNVPGEIVNQVLVQRMEKAVGEALVGIKRDPDVGPIVMVAAGGIYTEIYKDRSLRLAPVTLEVAREMVNEVKAFEALKGYRGHTAGDLEAVADTIVKLSRMAVSDAYDIVEAEINPLFVLEEGKGALAVDALITISE